MAKEKTRPKYNMAQNSWFMIKLAWTSGEKKVLVICLLLALSAVALNLINLYVSPAILAAVERKASVTELILTIAVFTLALMFVSAASSYGDTNAMYGRVSVRSEIITLLNRKAATTSYPNLFDEKFKKLQAKASEAVSSNRAPCEAVWTTLTDLTANILGFAFYVVLMSSVQPLLLAVILATTVLSYLVSNYLGGWEYRHRDEAAEYEEQMIYLNRRAGDPTLAKDIRIFGLRPWIEELYEKSMAAYTAFHKKAENAIVWAKVTDLVLTFFRNAAAYAYLTALVIGNRISVSEFLLLFSAAGGFTTWVSGILGGFHTLHSQSLEISTVREYLEYPEPFRFEDGEPIGAKMEMQRETEPGMRHGAEAGMQREAEAGMRHGAEAVMQRETEAGMPHEAEPVMQYKAKPEMQRGAESRMPHEAKLEMQREAEPEQQYEIRLENVSFRYPGAEKDTLTGINLTLHPGEKLAVVGLNGAGKTTLVKLICGFLDPTGGRVLLNGRDIRVYNRRDYYTMFSAVFQEFSLLAGTVAVNVAQDDADIDMERVKECVRRAGLGEKIESLKDGYETLLNRNVFEDAVSLSGGETQRLMLARALYKDAPFLILDEPTAALDPIAESELYQKYHEMTRGKSSVYISHRLASTRFCDRILMIADGGIAEMGTHEELLRMGGRYAGLYRVQSKYYEEGADENGGK